MMDNIDWKTILVLFMVVQTVFNVVAFLLFWALISIPKIHNCIEGVRPVAPPGFDVSKIVPQGQTGHSDVS